MSLANTNKYLPLYKMWNDYLRKIQEKWCYELSPNSVRNPITFNPCFKTGFIPLTPNARNHRFLRQLCLILQSDLRKLYWGVKRNQTFKTYFMLCPVTLVFINTGIWTNSEFTGSVDSASVEGNGIKGLKTVTSKNKALKE